MSVQLFVTLFVSFGIVASLITQAIKKATNDQWSDTLTNLIVSIVVGIVGMGVYYANVGMPINALNIVYAIFMAVAVWCGSTLGYSKVKEILEQLGG